MTTLAPTIAEELTLKPEPPSEGIWRRALSSGRVIAGGSVLLVILLLCVPTVFWTTDSHSNLYYDKQDDATTLQTPAWHPLSRWFGTDTLGRGLLGRCLLGGVISLTIGLGSAAIAVALGVAVGLVAGYRGGWVDAVLMRSVDVLYGLPG